MHLLTVVSLVSSMLLPSPHVGLPRQLPASFIRVVDECADPEVLRTPPLPVAVEANLLELVNQARSERGLPPLREDDRIAAAARRHARVMADHDAISHGFPDEPALVDRVVSTGIPFSTAGENVGRTNTSQVATTLHRGLMESPHHRANILGEDFDAVGIGVVADGDMYYITQLFVRLRPAHSDPPAAR